MSASSDPRSIRSPSGFSLDPATERKRLAEHIGNREHAPLLFRPKVPAPDVDFCGQLMLQRLGFAGGTNVVISDFTRMSDADVAVWGSRCWANTLGHLCETDSEVRKIIQVHGTYLPNVPAAVEALLGKVHSSFLFFLWVLTSPHRPLDLRDSCYAKMIVLTDAILIEDLQAKRDGSYGGRGLLDKSVAGVREIAGGFAIRRIKAIATNEQVYRAFLRRGFRDQPAVENLERHIENYAKPVELILTNGTP